MVYGECELQKEFDLTLSYKCEGFKNALDAKQEIWKGLNGWMLQSGAFVLGISKLGRCDMRHHARLSLRSRTLEPEPQPTFSFRYDAEKDRIDPASTIIAVIR